MIKNSKIGKNHT